MESQYAVFWFRRDLRLEDNAGLFHALTSGKAVIPLFIFDKQILDKLEKPFDARVDFIHQTLAELDAQLNAIGSSLQVYYGDPLSVWTQLTEQYAISAVYVNRDYEPYAINRDQLVEAFLVTQSIEFFSFKDHVVFEKDEVTKDDKNPYTVFTPYSRKWLLKLDAMAGHGAGEGPASLLDPFPSLDFIRAFAKIKRQLPFPSLESMGFAPTKMSFPAKTVPQGIIKNYDQTRDFPAIVGTSHLGVHFRFGTISIREKAKRALGLNRTFLNELIWRDFYAQILAHFPQVASRSFKPEYDLIKWRNDEQEFKHWCNGTTGYPIVDAGMRELNASGYMHNRVRMITASFLTKHLLIDWRWGEAYFAAKLLDFDLASNNGGWQWAAGCGTDAAPYFRVFNPYAQQEKFDKDFIYIKKWVPEYGTAAYPAPIVEHKLARERCLQVYKEGLAKAR